MAARARETTGQIWKGVGLVFFAVSKVLWAITAPGNALTLCLVVGAAVRAATPWRRLGALLIGAAAVGFAAIATLPLGLWLIAPLEARFPAPTAPPPEVAGLILLGGAVETAASSQARGVALTAAAERLTATAVLARRYPEAPVIVTGGSGAMLDPGAREAPHAARALAALGVAPSRLRPEPASRNTWQNAMQARRLADRSDQRPWVLITSAWHMPRAVGAFRAAGWSGRLLPWPVDYRTRADHAMPVRFWLARGVAELDLAVREWIGLVAYHLTGRSDRLFPRP